MRELEKLWWVRRICDSSTCDVTYSYVTDSLTCAVDECVRELEQFERVRYVVIYMRHDSLICVVIH